MPDANGFRLPPEWAPHEATWLAWPQDPDTWIAGLGAAQDAYIRMIAALAPGERIELIHPPGDAKTLHERLAAHDVSVHPTSRSHAPEQGVRLHEVPYVDSWLRDTGPLVLTRPDGHRLALDWRFNAWGGKYEKLEEDDALAHRIAQRANIECLRVQTVLEGGAIDADGTGRLLTTESCLLHENRGGRARRFLEDVFNVLLGVDDVLWLGEGLAGDDTDGHVDTIARVTDPGTVLACQPPPEGSRNHDALKANLRRLRTFQDEGRIDEIRLLPVPEAVTFQGKRFPASYANFYVGNEAVLVPVFGDDNDEVACAILETAFPNRRIVPVPARDLVVGYGACHCLTMQIPSTRPGSPR